MNEITKLLICIQPLLDASTYRHIQIISKALLILTGILGIIVSGRDYLFWMVQLVCFQLFLFFCPNSYF